MLAIWATANPDAALRYQACLAALDITSAVHRFNESSRTPQLPTRIGLHSGQMVLGSIGAIDHYEYRPVGEVVNTAARIESLNKHLGTRILVSREVLHQLDGFLLRQLGRFLLPGKTKPVEIYELLCRIEDAGSQQLNFCAEFAEALVAYRRQSWEQAIERFHKTMRIHKQDGPSLFYLVQYRNPGPQGQVRVQWLCHLNGSFVLFRRSFSYSKTSCYHLRPTWIPAYAGMTIIGGSLVAARSFLRRQESRRPM